MAISAESCLSFRFFFFGGGGGNKVGFLNRDFNNSSSIVIIIKIYIKYFHNDDVFADYS